MGTVADGKLKSTQMSQSNMKVDVIEFHCGNSYTTGGYAIDLRKYFSNIKYIRCTPNSQPYQAYWDQTTGKLLVTTGDNVEVANGTDLSAVSFLIESIDAPGISKPDLTPTTPVQAGSGSGALLKAGDTSKTSGTLELQSGTTTKISGVLSETPVRITGSTIPLTSTRFTAAIADVSTISTVDGTPNDGTKISIFFYDAGITVTSGGSFLNAGSASFVSKANDSITWQYDVSVGKFVMQNSPQFDGTNITYVNGYVKNVGEVIIPPATTPITANSQVVQGTGNWTTSAATPSELSNFAPPTNLATGEEKIFVITAGEAVRLLSNSAPGVTPGVYGNIQLGGYAWLDMNPGDKAYFRWDSGNNLWRVDHFVYA